MIQETVERIVRETRTQKRAVTWDRRRAELVGLPWHIVTKSIATIKLHQMAKQLSDYPLLGVPTIGGALPPKIIKERLFIADVEAQIQSELNNL